MFLKTNTNYYNHLKEKGNLIEEVKTSLVEYLEYNFFPKEIIDEITCEDFINSNPLYYLYYPYLFNTYFDIKDREVLNLLSISGFLYYKSIILIDDIFDNKKQQNNFQQFFIANICQEETVKLLSSLFSIKSDFWQTWNMRKLEYAKAYKLDKNLKTIKDFTEFEVLADYKSTFGKIAIDCLYHLSDKKEKTLYKSLLESHKFYYVGFQIMDDISDYTEDNENGQFNIAKNELINVLESKNDTLEKYSLKDQKKIIYLEGISEGLYDKAITYLDKSSELLLRFKSHEQSLWLTEIDSLYNTGISHFLNIKGFINVFNSEHHLTINTKQNNGLSESLLYSLNYLKEKQLSDGCWNDIFNDAGISNVWTTAFVTYALDEFISESFLTDAKKYLTNNQSPNGLWGYNSIWVEDADSSSFAFLALANYQNISHNDINKWFNYQNKDGGFTTYNDKNILLSSLNSVHVDNVNGWLQSHFCVSAVAYLVIIQSNFLLDKQFYQLRNYLLNQLNSSSKTLSYWWTEDIYALYFMLLGATKNSDQEIIDLIEKRIENLIRENKKLNNFFNGFLLKSLCLTDKLFHKHTNKIEKLVSLILNNQFTDGSWQEDFSLKIPHPSILNSNNPNINWELGNKGTNILVKDYNRVFTTTSCLTALIAYESRVR